MTDAMPPPQRRPFNGGLQYTQPRDATDERYRDLRRPRKVRLFCNGDRFFKGKKVNITPHRYHSFNDMLNDLTGKLPASVNLPYGVRQIFTIDGGQRIRDIGDLEDGKAYVCAGFEGYRSMKYGTESLEPWSFGKAQNDYYDNPFNTAASSFNSNRGYYGAFHPSKTLRQSYPMGSRPIGKYGSLGGSKGGLWGGTSQAQDINSKPKVITVVRNSTKPRANVKILLNRRSVQSYEHLVKDISEAFGPKWKHNKVQTIFTIKGREVHGVNDFFRDDDVFIAAGTETLSIGEVKDMLEELYPDSPYPKNLLKEWDKMRGRHQKKSDDDKKDSGFLGSDESNKGDDDIVYEGKRSPDHPKKKKRNLSLTGKDEEAIKKYENERLKNTEEERDKMRRKMQKRLEAERKAIDEEKRKKGLMPLKPISDPYKKLQEEKEKERELEREKEKERERREKEALEKAHREEEERILREKEIAKRERKERKEREQKALEQKALEQKEQEQKIQERKDSIRSQDVHDDDMGRKNKVSKKSKDKSDIADAQSIKTARSKKSHDGYDSDKENLLRTHSKSMDIDSGFVSGRHATSDRSLEEDMLHRQLELERIQKEKEEMEKAKREEEEKQRKQEEEEARKAAEAEAARRKELEELERKAAEEREREERERQEAEKKKEEEKRKEHEQKMQQEKLKKRRSKSKIVFKSKLERQISNVEHVLEKYDAGKVLGDGNFAVVKQCKLRETNHEFAMKIIDKSKLRGKEHMIENEIEIMKLCNQVNIVKLVEEFETQKEIYLIMELVKGGDLFDAITQSVKFGEPESANMVSDLCQALFYLHSRGIVHRDLKPENLLVCRNKDGTITLKLADFGLAMEVKEPIYTVCGTPTYVAPEILAERGYGLEVDMWAVGVITYILLCGFPPFRSNNRNQSELFELIKSGEYEFIMPYWQDVKKGAKDLVSRLLIVDVKKRYTAVDTLLHPWVITRGDTFRPPQPMMQYRENMRRELEIQAKANRESYLKTRNTPRPL